MTVHGQTAHASRYPEVGENALISGGRLAAAIEALPTLRHPHLKHGTWCVRYMEGGNPSTLVVPEKCYLFVDRYVVPGETDEICIAQIMEAAGQLGIPVVTFGPSGGNMHGDNEYGYAWQVKNCGEVYRRTVARLLSGEV